MESNEQYPDGLGEAKIALTQAQAARDRMAAGLVLPSFFYSSIGGVIAVQIGTSAAALGVNQPATWGWVVLIAGLVAFALVAAVQLARFRRLNGVWLGALASRVVLGTATLTSLSYTAAFVGATLAAIARWWWLVPLAAIAGGAVYAWFGQRWWRSYQADPDQRGRDDSKAVLLILPVLAGAGLVALLIGH